MESPIPTPQARTAVHDLYERESDTHRADFARLSELDRKYSNWRLLIFGLVLAGGALAIPDVEHSPALLVIPLAAAGVFVRLLMLHDRVLNDLDRGKSLVDYYEAGVARLEDRWAGKGEAGLRYQDSHHPYSADLDLFGAGSLFELLCQAKTRMGQDCLADWIRASAEPQTVRLRQEAVKELAGNPDLRRDLAASAPGLHARISAATLINWGERPIVLRRGVALRVAVGVLSGCSVIAGIAWLAGLSPIPFYLFAAATQATAGLKGKQVTRAVGGVAEPIGDLTRLSAMLARIESDSFNSDLLRTIQANLAPEGGKVSEKIERLCKLQGYLDARRNVLIAPFAVLLCLTFHVAYALEQWREENGTLIPGWLQALGEIEALASLATYSFENPQDVWPNIDEQRVNLEATGLGHPLLPLDRMVRNNVALDDSTCLWIISGSNMSGKSTLLRAVGVNVVLTFAGAPVRAERMILSPVTLGASIRTLDSLQEGVSRFYAEISRLRQILDIARTRPPCLFLLDEILHGTNSHDRRIGAEAVAGALVEARAIGLMTTHDLAIARIADNDSRARNMHFEDHLSEGKMAFDYQLREGVVTKSNAIELMRSVGLPV